MQSQTSLAKKIMPLFVVFILVNAATMVLKNKLQLLNINADVVMGANCILFFVSSLSIALHKRAISTNNPNAIVRTMMAASLLKLMIAAFSVVIYIIIAKEKRNSYGVFCGMALYVIYTILEVKIASKMRKENGNK